MVTQLGTINCYQKHREKRLQESKDYAKTLRGRFTSLKKQAKARDKEFMLSFVECLELWSGECAYCGLEEFEKMGIDRVDSSQGYIQGNVASCCSTCNYMKLDRDLDSFLERCNLVAAKHPKLI